MEHTKEPWRGSGGMGYIYGTSLGGCRKTIAEFVIAQIRGWGHLSYLGEEKALAIQKANEERIVACVNALAGIEDPAAWVAEAKKAMADKKAGEPAPSRARREGEEPH